MFEGKTEPSAEEISSAEKIKTVPRLLKQSSGNNSKIVCFRNIPQISLKITQAVN
ncbi:MAG: hypothetical protein WCC17_14415 [Candidatus Nitrosopolaris sp.]